MKSLLLISSLFASAVDAKSQTFVTGTNIGGWMVLEPWITPSLFYRFLDKKHSQGVGMDSWSLCEALGPVEGNKLMKAHWDTWYTEDHIKKLSERGVQMVRLPIGDWTLKPYGPYVGCMDGAEDKISWMFDTCAKYNIQVLLDVHGAKDSQNGFDNSGKTQKVEWSDDTHFSHWAHPQANWLGDWNLTTQKYDNVNYENLKWSLDVMTGLLQKWGSHSAFGALEPVNEPWQNTPLDVLKPFYRLVKKLVEKYSPKAKFVFHDSFRPDPKIWNDLFEDGDHDNVVMDHHYYQAFHGGVFNNTQESCENWESIAAPFDKIKYDVWIGEFALATDVCAHWLLGFNDGHMEPQHTCKWVDCPYSYLPPSHAVDFDRKAESLGPFGSGNQTQVGIHKGKCSTDSEFFTHSQIEEISRCALKAWDSHMQGSFFWTAHNEIEEKWDYIRAWDLGWINKTALPDESTHYKYVQNAEEQQLSFLQ